MKILKRKEQMRSSRNLTVDEDAVHKECEGRYAPVDLREHVCDTEARAVGAHLEKNVVKQWL